MPYTVGIVRGLDAHGRITIPRPLREQIGLDAVEILVDGDSIVLRPYRPGCSLCRAVDVPIMPVGRERICRDCLRRLAGGDGA